MRGRNGLGHKDKPFKNVLDKKYEQINEIEMFVVYLQVKLMQYIFYYNDHYQFSIDIQ